MRFEGIPVEPGRLPTMRELVARSKGKRANTGSGEARQIGRALHTVSTEPCLVGLEEMRARRQPAPDQPGGRELRIMRLRRADSSLCKSGHFQMYEVTYRTERGDVAYPLCALALAFQIVALMAWLDGDPDVQEL